MTQPLDLSDAAIAAIWREHHRHLIDVAYRMLGSVFLLQRELRQ